MLLVFTLTLFASAWACRRTTPAENVSTLHACVEPTPLTFDNAAAPLLATSCAASCHIGAAPAAGVAFDVLHDDATATAALPNLRHAVVRLQAGTMPPRPRPAADACLVQIFSHYVDQLAAASCAATAHPDAVTLRRLTRREYAQTLEDQLGASRTVADDLPPDDSGFGFDNVAGVLGASPLHVERWLEIADRVATAALPDAALRTRPFDAATATGTGSGEPRAGGGYSVSGNGAIELPAEIGVDGTYLIRVRAYGEQAGPEPAKMAVFVDHAGIGPSIDVAAVAAAPGVYEQRTRLRAGNRTISIAFLNDYWRPDDPPPHDRNLIVLGWEIEGPLGPPQLPPLYRDVMTCDPDGADGDRCVTSIFATLGAKLFRQPMDDADAARYASFVALARGEGEPTIRGLQLGLQAMLVSPRFLYRVEDLATQPEQPVSAFELATRLSYFLWSRPPDTELMTAAANGTLLDDATLTAQVRRMLRDPKVEALTTNFADQWLATRGLDSAAPDRAAFPDFDDALRDSMRAETQQFFSAQLLLGADLRALLTADYTFVDARLARHYGLTAPAGTGFAMTPLPADSPRRGLLGKAAILTATSHADRTSPVKRGKWVLERLLCAPPPPPPPDVPPLPDGDGATGTLRQRLEAHRSNPACSGCHTVMDPMGFALENFDAVGAWRTSDEYGPIDATVDFGDGPLTGPVALADRLAEDPRFTHCVAEKAMIYALGRGLEAHDRCAVDDVATRLEATGRRLDDVFVEIARTPSFRQRQATGGTP